MEELQLINLKLATYLEEAYSRLWLRAHLPDNKYNIETSNIAESINAAFKLSRGFPITFLLEYIREKLGMWFYKRREDETSLTTCHSWGVGYLMSIRGHYAEKMVAERINTWRFYVKGGPQNCLVDIEQRMCECGVFQIEKMPCSHALAAASEAQLHVFTLVCPTYTKDYLHASYAHNIYLKSEYGKSSRLEQCLPPIVKILPGRRKKSRWQSWLDIARTRQSRPRTTPK